MIYIWEAKKEKRESDVKEQGSKRMKKRDNEREQENGRTGERLDMIEAVRAPNCVFARDAFRGR